MTIDPDLRALDALPNWRPIPDDQLTSARPDEYLHLKTARALDRRRPKQDGKHRWVTDVRRLDSRAGPHVLELTWCWDCGSVKHAPDTPLHCANGARDAQEYVFARNRADDERMAGLREQRERRSS